MSTESLTHPTKFEINIEGSIYPWDSPVITAADLRSLAGIPADQPMLEVNLKTNEERTLNEGELIELKHGHGFAKKVRYQRG